MPTKVCVLFLSLVKMLQRQDTSLCLSFSEDLQSVFWPRFRHILNLNIASVRDADPSKLSRIDTRPHYVGKECSLAWPWWVTSCELCLLVTLADHQKIR